MTGPSAVTLHDRLLGSRVRPADGADCVVVRLTDEGTGGTPALQTPGMRCRDRGAYGCPQSPSGNRTYRDLGSDVQARLQQAPLVGAQREVLIALARRESSHRPIRHETIELSPNSTEFIVFAKLVYAHNPAIPGSAPTKLPVVTSRECQGRGEIDIRPWRMDGNTVMSSFRQ
jgi:hypothetical protein